MFFILLRRLGSRGPRYGLWLPVLSALCIGSCSLIFSEPSSAPDASTGNADASTSDADASAGDADASAGDADASTSDADAGVCSEEDDVDGDGYCFPADCDEGSGAINPGSPEVCDYIDNNCDGSIDEGCTAMQRI